MRFELGESASSKTANDKMAEVAKPEKPLNEYVLTILIFTKPLDLLHGNEAFPLVYF